MNSSFHSDELLKDLNSSVQNMLFFSELLEDGYDLRLKVTGRSMSPFLETGSVVTLSRVPLSKLHIGDIIFCQCDNKSFKLHRLIQIKNKKLLTKGDALRAFDSPFAKSDYKGKVIRHEPLRSSSLVCRDMENPSARIKNYLIARYQQLKSYILSKHFGLRSISAKLFSLF